MTQQQEQRRTFLKQTAGAAAATGLLGIWPRAFAQGPGEGAG
ncbi:twin-arginine translocation signal domain-containing protein, partial [Variovorax sp. Varisp62]